MPDVIIFCSVIELQAVYLLAQSHLSTCQAQWGNSEAAMGVSVALQVLQEMLDILHEHENQVHAARLEIIVIWLIGASSSAQSLFTDFSLSCDQSLRFCATSLACTSHGSRL